MAFFKKKNTRQDGTTEEVTGESAASLNIPKENSEELAAVIMAAVMNFMNASPAGSLRIKSIKRIGRNSPVWNTAGRDEYITSKL